MSKPLIARLGKNRSHVWSDADYYDRRKPRCWATDSVFSGQLSTAATIECTRCRKIMEKEKAKP